MSNYTKTTNFTAKDALPTGDTNKIVRGSEIDTEFTNIATAITSKADSSDLTSTNTNVTTLLTNPNICDGRLTLTTAVPVTTSDVTAATNLYFTPYKGNRISLYSSSAWSVLSFSERSIAIPATTSNLYDVFIYSNSGTPTLELLQWSSDTVRATALTTQDGVLVKSGDATRRYLGSVRTTGVSGQTEDSEAKRYLWNYYNRVDRVLKGATETTDSWVYTTDVWRQANSNTANQVDVVVGYAEDTIFIEVVGNSNNAATSTRAVGIGVDLTNADSSQIRGVCSAGVTNEVLTSTARYRKVPAVGRHFYPWLERAVALGTTTWYGDNGNVHIQSGISGIFKM
jgi:hypothetical protein